MDRNELKIQALVEKISNLTAMYENQAADYRVEITILNQDKEDLVTELSGVRSQLEAAFPKAEVGEDVPQEDSEDSTD